MTQLGRPDLVAECDQIQARCRDIAARLNASAVTSSDLVCGRLDTRCDRGPSRYRSVAREARYHASKLYQLASEFCQLLFESVYFRLHIRVSHDSPSVDDGGAKYVSADETAAVEGSVHW